MAVDCIDGSLLGYTSLYEAPFGQARWTIESYGSSSWIQTPHLRCTSTLKVVSVAARWLTQFASFFLNFVASLVILQGRFFT